MRRDWHARVEFGLGGKGCLHLDREVSLRREKHFDDEWQGEPPYREDGDDVDREDFCDNDGEPDDEVIVGKVVQYSTNLKFLITLCKSNTSLNYLNDNIHCSK